MSSSWSPKKLSAAVHEGWDVGASRLVLDTTPLGGTTTVVAKNILGGARLTFSDVVAVDDLAWGGKHRGVKFSGRMSALGLDAAPVDVMVAMAGGEPRLVVVVHVTAAAPSWDIAVTLPGLRGHPLGELRRGAAKTDRVALIVSSKNFDYGTLHEGRWDPEGTEGRPLQVRWGLSLVGKLDASDPRLADLRWLIPESAPLFFGQLSDHKGKAPVQASNSRYVEIAMLPARGRLLPEDTGDITLSVRAPAPDGKGSRDGCGVRLNVVPSGDHSLPFYAVLHPAPARILELHLATATGEAPPGLVALAALPGLGRLADALPAGLAEADLVLRDAWVSVGLETREPEKASVKLVGLANTSLELGEGLAAIRNLALTLTVSLDPDLNASCRKPSTSLSGDLRLFGADFRATVDWPKQSGRFALLPYPVAADGSAKMGEDNHLRLRAVVEAFAPELADEVPNLKVSAMSMELGLKEGELSIALTVEDIWALEVADTSFGLSKVAFRIARSKRGKPVHGSLSGVLEIGGVELVVSVKRKENGKGWAFEGGTAAGAEIDLDRLITDLARRADAEVELDGIPDIDVDQLFLSADSEHGTFQLTMGTEVDLPLQLARRELELRARLQLGLEKDPVSKEKVLCLEFVGGLELGGHRFELTYRKDRYDQLVRGSWTATGDQTLGFEDVAAGIGVPAEQGLARDVKVGLGLVSASFEYSLASKRFVLSAVSQKLGAAAFVAGQHEGKWGFAFCLELPSTRGLSAVSHKLAAMPKIPYESAAMCISSMEMKDFTLSHISAVAHRPVTLAKGLTLVLVMDLDKKSEQTDAVRRITGSSGKMSFIAGFNLREVYLEAKLGGSLTIEGGKGESLRLSDTALRLFASPPSFGFELRGRYDFAIQGTPVSATMAVALSTSEMRGSLMLEAEEPGIRLAPMKGLYLDEIGGSVGIQYTPPALTLGLQGGFHIVGQKSGSNEFAIVLQIYEKAPYLVLFYSKIARASLPVLMSALTGREPRLPKPLSSIEASNLLLYYCTRPPNGAVVKLPDGSVAMEGFAFSGAIRILNWEAYAHLYMHAEYGFSGHAQMSPLVLPRRSLDKVSAPALEVAATLSGVPLAVLQQQIAKLDRDAGKAPRGKDRRRRREDGSFVLLALTGDGEEHWVESFATGEMIKVVDAGGPVLTFDPMNEVVLHFSAGVQFLEVFEREAAITIGHEGLAVEMKLLELSDIFASSMAVNIDKQGLDARAKLRFDLDFLFPLDEIVGFIVDMGEEFVDFWIDVGQFLAEGIKEFFKCARAWFKMSRKERKELREERRRRRKESDRETLTRITKGFLKDEFQADFDASKLDVDVELFADLVMVLSGQVFELVARGGLKIEHQEFAFADFRLSAPPSELRDIRVLLREFVKPIVMKLVLGPVDRLADAFRRSKNDVEKMQAEYERLERDERRAHQAKLQAIEEGGDTLLEEVKQETAKAEQQAQQAAHAIATLFRPILADREQRRDKVIVQAIALRDQILGVYGLRIRELETRRDKARKDRPIADKRIRDRARDARRIRRGKVDEVLSIFRRETDRRLREIGKGLPERRDKTRERRKSRREELEGRRKRARDRAKKLGLNMDELGDELLDRIQLRPGCLQIDGKVIPFGPAFADNLVRHKLAREGKQRKAIRKARQEQRRSKRKG